MQGNDDPVFWAEGDDEAVNIRGMSSPRRSLYAYLLLNKTVVIHPAYLLQYDDTHNLVIAQHDDLMRPPNAKLILGDSRDAHEYFAQRLEKLHRHRDRKLGVNNELQQYERHAKTLDDISAYLNDSFVTNDGVHPISWSRDALFRELVRADLDTQSFVDGSLYAILYLDRRVFAEWKLPTIIKRLNDLTYVESRLISHDAIVNAVVKEGYPRTQLGSFSDRLHILHWMAQQGEGLSVPLLGRVSDSRLEPDDPEVFWNAVNAVMGFDFATTLVSLSDHFARNIISELRNDSLWRRFVAEYRSIVNLVNEECGQVSEDHIIKGVKKQFPSRVAGAAGKFSKRSIISLVFGGATISTGNIPLMIIGGVGFLATASQVIDDTRAAIESFFRNERGAIQVRVNSLLKGEMR